LGYLFAGQEGGYVYRTTFTTIGIENLGTGIPVNFNLYQNYPNPFNPSTTIKFDVPSVGERHSGISGFHTTKLILYDILGKVITTMVNEELKPGSYQIQWDASGYTSGVYFYRVIIGDYSATNKMMLVK